MVSTHPTYPSLVSSIWRFFPLPMQTNGFDLCFEKKQRAPQNSLTKFKNQRAHDRLELHNGTNGIVLAKKKKGNHCRTKIVQNHGDRGSKHQPIAKIAVSEKRFQHLFPSKMMSSNVCPTHWLQTQNMETNKNKHEPVVCCAMCYKTISLISSPSPVFRFFSFVVSGPQRVVSYDHWCAPQDISGNMLPSAVVQVPLGQIE